MKSRVIVDMGRSHEQVPAPVVRRIFNPLNEVIATAVLSDAETNGERMTSLSRIENTKVGTCPKCKKPMTYASIANGDEVYYCDTDRVSTPLPDAE